MRPAPLMSRDPTYFEPCTWRLSATSGGDVIDAEFVRDDDEQIGYSGGAPMSTTVADIALDAAPEWKDIVVEFVSRTPSGNLNVIPCRMPFTVNIDGQVYSIGMPFEECVAVLEDDANGQLSSLVDPDDDANEEIFQLAATALTENMGNELRLRRTPRVLTVQGDLKAITGKYLEESQAEPVQAKALSKMKRTTMMPSLIAFSERSLGRITKRSLRLRMTRSMRTNCSTFSICPALAPRRIMTRPSKDYWMKSLLIVKVDHNQQTE